jgi:hypothetical protein
MALRLLGIAQFHIDEAEDRTRPAKSPDSAQSRRIRRKQWWASGFFLLVEEENLKRLIMPL